MSAEPSYIEEVRLTAFKSFKGAVLPLDEMTLLVGRNGSGKSNALDGLGALARLAQGEDIRDALDGGLEGPAVRGGAAGCAPFGKRAFTLGCTVRTGSRRVLLDVTVQIEPMVQVVSEKLSEGRRVLLETDPPSEHSSDITARWANGGKGRNPRVAFRDSRLLTTQVLSRVPATPAGESIHRAAAQVLDALRSVFILDPVPDQMRQYVPRRDLVLRRNANNLSAAVASLLKEPATGTQLCAALSQLNEQEVVSVTTSRSKLDDVMLTLVERFAGRKRQVSARVMSDGSLRFLAILVALLQSPPLDMVPQLDSEDAAGQKTLVIEELENGLHASQAQLLMRLVRDEVRGRRVRALATAHSPPLLDALTGDEHRGVCVCQRDREGFSTVRRLVDLPNYVEIIAIGGLGRAAVRDRLRETPQPTQSPSEALSEILRGPVQ